MEEKWRGSQFEYRALSCLPDLNPIGSDDWQCNHKNELLIQWHFSSGQKVDKKGRLVYQLSAIYHMD